MKIQSAMRRCTLALLTGGALFAGPCGITTLQLQDFITSTAIRTLVTTTAQIVEAVIIQDATGGP